jgi:hypothetical protein
MMTDFQKQRIDFFIKCAEKYDYVRLGPGDIDLFKQLIKTKLEMYTEGYIDGKKAVDKEVKVC